MSDLTKIVETQTVQITGSDSIGNTQTPVQSTSAGALSIDLKQIGENGIVTGTGSSGLGIPRVTVANDSKINIWDGTNTETLKPLNVQVVSTDVGLVTNSVIHGLSSGGGGGYVDVKVNPSGALTTESNITQFGGNNLVIGTGTSGLGIPRVTVSNDSNILATQSGSWTVTADQGTNPWVVIQNDASSTNVSGTFTSTGNSSTIDSSGYSSISFTVNVSAVSGTTPTLDVQLQSSQDGTTNWEEVYDVERFTSTGTQFVPIMRLHARYYRFVYTISGTTPSFTFNIKTTLKASSAPTRFCYNQYNALVMTTSNNFSPAVDLEGCSFFSFVITRGAGGAGVTVAPQFSNDGVNWVTGTNTISTAASLSYIQTNGQATNMARYARLTNTNSSSSATTLDIRWYAKE